MDYTHFLASSYEDPCSSTLQYPILNLRARLDQAILFENIKNNSNPNFIEPSAFLSLDQEETDPFGVRDNPDDVVLSDFHIQSQSSPVCNSLCTNSEDYAKDYFQTCKSQGLSHFEKKNLQENNEFLAPTNQEFWGFNNEKQTINHVNNMYQNIEPRTNNYLNIQPTDYMQTTPIVIPPFDSWNMPAVCNMLKANSSLSESTNAGDTNFCHSPIQLKNQKRLSQTTQSRLKKKKKTENNVRKDENSEISPPCLKLKKSKSEFDRNIFLMTPEPSLLSQCTGTPCNQQGASILWNAFPASCQLPYLEHSNEKSEREERSTDISYCTPICTKLEDSPKFFNTNSTPIQQLNQMQNQCVASCDLSERVTYPVAYDDHFSNPKNMMCGKRIGTLTVEERQAKIEKYLQKRKQRSWNKKISYDCRKRVADGRLRIRGRFVTKSHAFAILEADGVEYDPEKITMGEIKDYLTKKFMDHPHSQDNQKMSHFDEECFNFEAKKEEGEGELSYGINDDFAMSPMRSDDGKCGFPYN